MMEIKHKSFTAEATVEARQLLNDFIRNKPIPKENIINISYSMNLNDLYPFTYNLFYWDLATNV